MVYHYFIPHNYYDQLVNGSLRWAKNSQGARIGYPFYNILRISKTVSEESLDILYGDNTFVTSYEEGGNPFLSVITEKNRGRIKSEQWHMICDTDLRDWDGSWIYRCGIYLEICEVSIYVYMRVSDYRANEERPISLIFWDDEFILRPRAIMKMMVPRSTRTKVFLDTDPDFNEGMMADVEAIFDTYLIEDYEIWKW
jgi:hypothetical protein